MFPLSAPRPPRSRRRAVVALLALLALAPACGGSGGGEPNEAATTAPAPTEAAPVVTEAEEPDEADPEDEGDDELEALAELLDAGTCVAEVPDPDDIDDDDPATDDPYWETAVPCDEPHRVEVFHTFDAPDPDLSYDEILQPDTPGYDELAIYASEICGAVLEVVVGADRISALGEVDEQVTVFPYFATEHVNVHTYDPAPRELWEAGWTKGICYVVFGDDDPPAVAELLEPGTPHLDPYRLCQAYDEERTASAVTCDEPHARELVAQIAVSELVEEGVLGNVLPDETADVDTIDAFYAVADGLCVDLVEHLRLPVPSYAEVLAEADAPNWPFSSHTGTHYTLNCMVIDVDRDNALYGSVFG